MLFVPMIVILGYLESMIQTRTEQRLDGRSVGGWRTASICLSKDAQDTSCASCSLVFARSWLVALQGNESFSFLVLHEYLRVNSSTTPIPHQVGCASGDRDSTAVSCLSPVMHYQSGNGYQGSFRNSKTRIAVDQDRRVIQGYAYKMPSGTPFWHNHRRYEVRGGL